jgi:release factor glutamine methyltransferase
MVTSKCGAETTIGETLSSLISRLEKTSDTPGLDAQVLMARLLDRPRSWVISHPEERLTGTQHVALKAKIDRLEGGEPLPYILEMWEFFGLEFEVTPDVLIPRPETELLVERAIAWLRKSNYESGELRVLDVGTGSGCIAISMAVNVPGIQIIATDISPAALKVARGNAEKMNVSNCITFLEADLFPDHSTSNSFSLVVANPPYIPTKTLQKLPVFCYEPTMALDGGVDGLTFIRRILRKTPNYLLPGGLLLMEIEASEGLEVIALASDAYPNTRIYLHKDLAGYDRLLEIHL